MDRFEAGPNAVVTENGFAAADPVVFCTQDRDTNNCAGTKGAPGWYGSDCNGYSLFVDIPKWPVGGNDTTASSLFVSAERISAGFYVDQ